MKVKNVLTGFAILITVGYAYGKSKLNQLQTVVKALQVSLNTINSVSVSNNIFKANIRLNIKNTTNTNLDVITKDLIQLTHIDFYTSKNTFIGRAKTIVSDLQINANDTFITAPINVEVPLKNLNFTAITEIITNSKNIIVVPTINFLGKEIKL